MPFFWSDAVKTLAGAEPGLPEEPEFPAEAEEEEPEFPAEAEEEEPAEGASSEAGGGAV